MQELTEEEISAVSGADFSAAHFTAGFCLALEIALIMACL